MNFFIIIIFKLCSNTTFLTMYMYCKFPNSSASMWGLESYKIWILTTLETAGSASALTSLAPIYITTKLCLQWVTGHIYNIFCRLVIATDRYKLIFAQLADHPHQNASTHPDRNFGGIWFDKKIGIPIPTYKWVTHCKVNLNFDFVVLFFCNEFLTRKFDFRYYCEKRV